MSALSYYLILGLLLCFQNQSDQKVYQVKKVDHEIGINGQGTDPAWDKAAILTDFQLPWDEEIPQPTSFRALWSDSALYLLYEVIDHDIVAPGPPKDKRGVLPSDRVEIFFKVGGEMSPYYCLELDPRSRILDYQARYYRETDFDWFWPSGHLQVLSSSREDGYVVEVRISMQSIKDLMLINDDQSLDVGLFRGDFQTIGHQRTEVKWISWVKPDSEKPDFHIPSAFGKLILTPEQ